MWSRSPRTRWPTLLTIGGDHTIALPILRSLAYTHGTPFRRSSEEGVIDMERST
jgi:agmatinase